MTAKQAQLNRQKAIQQGLSKYKGRPCRNCKTSEKYVRTSGCVKCDKVRAKKYLSSYYQLHKTEHAIKAKRHYWDNRDNELKKMRSRHLVSKYGLTMEEYDVLVKKQHNKCAICKQLPTSGRYKKLVVDHNHRTKKVRKLLCDSCNLILGKTKESIKLHKQFIAYIKEMN